MNFTTLLVGEPCVGKSSFLNSFIESGFNNKYEETIGLEFGKKKINFKENTHSLHIWDISGNEKYKTCTKSCYKRSNAFLIFFDITCENSFANVEKWINIIDDFRINKEYVIVMVGNKSDLEEERKVSVNDANEFANKHKINYIETSAKDKINLENAFKLIMHDYDQKYKIPDPILYENNEKGFNCFSFLKYLI
jgi:small GTP-binding protein